MITPTSATPRDLVGLAERMGIPTEDAVHHVLQHLTDQQLSDTTSSRAAQSEL